MQVETWILGFKLGLEEGVELHVLDLPLGVHLWPPGITVPVNPGRIGFDDSTHRPATQHRRYRSSYDEDRDRRYGLVSLWLWSKYARFAHPNDAAGLSDMATIGFHTRAAYGKTLGYAFGVDLEAGAGFPASFAYAARLYPAGVALMLGDITFLGVDADRQRRCPWSRSSEIRAAGRGALGSRHRTDGPRRRAGRRGVVPR